MLLLHHLHPLRAASVAVSTKERPLAKKMSRGRWKFRPRRLMQRPRRTRPVHDHKHCTEWRLPGTDEVADKLNLLAMEGGGGGGATAGTGQPKKTIYQVATISLFDWPTNWSPVYWATSHLAALGWGN